MFSPTRKRVAILIISIAATCWATMSTSSALEAGKTQYASVTEPGVVIAPGDFARTTVYFGAWNLVCDYLLSAKRRVCVIEQQLSNSDVTLQWRLGLTKDGKPTLIFDISNTVDREPGLVLRVGKFVTTMPFEDCNQTCRSAIPFDSMIEKAALSGELFGFGYTKAGTGGAIVADLRGFKEALAVSAKPPTLVFGEPAPAVAKKRN